LNAKHTIAALSFLAVSTLASPVRADLIVPASVVVNGVPWGGDAALLADGVVRDRGSFWSDSTVYWGSAGGVSIDIDLGAVYSLADLLVGVDNNDDYVFEGSVDGVTYTEFFRFLASDGPLGPTPGGLEILTTRSAYPTAPADASTPAYVGRSLPDVSARYLRVTAAEGDGYYAVGEVQVFSAPPAVPEPASLAMLALGGLAAGMTARRSRRSA
jgi:hypothetical protein